MSYWDDINKNTVDSAHGACPTMFINTATAYKSDKDGKNYTFYTNSLVSIIPETSSDIVSLVAIPSASTISPDDTYVSSMTIGVISTGRKCTVHLQQIYHRSEPGEKDSKVEKREEFIYDHSISYNGVKYYITEMIPDFQYASNTEYFRNGFNYTYWGNQSVTISTKYNGVFRHIASEGVLSYALYWSSLPIFDKTIEDNNKKGELIYNILYNDWGTELQENPKNTSTTWNLYIDGTKNPLYKLTWNCASVKSSDVSRVKVMFCGYDETTNVYIVKDTETYAYNKKSVK